MTAATISELEVRADWAELPAQRGAQRARLNRIEDYLFIGGDRLSAAEAADRLGVSRRTVVRYRAALRAAGAEPHAEPKTGPASSRQVQQEQAAAYRHADDRGRA